MKKWNRSNHLAMTSTPFPPYASSDTRALSQETRALSPEPQDRLGAQGITCPESEDASRVAEEVSPAELNQSAVPRIQGGAREDASPVEENQATAR